MCIKNFEFDKEVAKKFFTSLRNKPTIKLVTHHGIFHADDVCCAAFISNVLSNSNVELVRTRENLETFDLMLDVGREDIITEAQIKLDHHQPEASQQRYLNGVKACALAKLVEVYYADEKPMFKNLLRKKLLYPVSANDNGQDIEGLQANPFSWVKFFNPQDNQSQQQSNVMFCKAVEIARVILKKIMASVESTMENIPVWEAGLNSMTPDGIVVLDKGVPWMEYMYGSDAEDIIKYIIFPHITHGWVLRTVPTIEGGFVAKYPLPYGWWGASIEDNKFDGLEFCHNTGFMAVFGTREQALAGAEYAVSQL